MPTYDRHFVNTPKRYVLPSPNSSRTWESSNWGVNEKRPLMTKERLKVLAMFDEKLRNNFANKTMGF